MIQAITAPVDMQRYAVAVVPKHGHPSYQQGGADTIMLFSWPLATITPRRLQRDWTFFTNLVFSPSGTRLAVVQGSRDIEIIDVITGQALARSTAESEQLRLELAWSPDERVLVVVEDRKQIVFYDGTTLAKKATFPLSYASGLAFSPDNVFLAVGSWEQGVVLRYHQILSEETR